MPPWQHPSLFVRISTLDTVFYNHCCPPRENDRIGFFTEWALSGGLFSKNASFRMQLAEMERTMSSHSTRVYRMIRAGEIRLDILILYRKSVMNAAGLLYCEKYCEKNARTLPWKIRLHETCTLAHRHQGDHDYSPVTRGCRLTEWKGARKGSPAQVMAGHPMRRGRTRLWNTRSSSPGDGVPCQYPNHIASPSFQPTRYPARYTFPLPP